jgi:hypothetical protein
MHLALLPMDEADENAVIVNALSGRQRPSARRRTRVRDLFLGPRHLGQSGALLETVLDRCPSASRCRRLRRRDACDGHAEG